MAKPGKAAAIAELTDRFRGSGAAVLTEYRGLTVAQLTELRGTIREHASYSVVKNTLTEIAAKAAGVTAFDGHLAGPSAIAFITGDPVAVARGLRDFAKAHPRLVIKAGVLDGKALSPEEITKLADLESREVLLAKLAGAMNASLTQAVYLFAAPLSQVARVVDALRAKVEAEGGPVAPATDAEVEGSPVAPATDAEVEGGPVTPATDAEVEGVQDTAEVEGVQDTAEVEGVQDTADRADDASVAAAADDGAAGGDES